jgi:hypothetical protein
VRCSPLFEKSILCPLEQNEKQLLSLQLVLQVDLLIGDSVTKDDDLTAQCQESRKISLRTMPRQQSRELSML